MDTDKWYSKISTLIRNREYATLRSDNISEEELNAADLDAEPVKHQRPNAEDLNHGSEYDFDSGFLLRASEHAAEERQTSMSSLETHSIYANSHEVHSKADERYPPTTHVKPRQLNTPIQ